MQLYNNILIPASGTYNAFNATSSGYPIRGINKTAIKNFDLSLPQFADLVELTKSYAGAMTHYALDGFKDVPENIYNERISICQSCDKYLPKINKCEVCGCKMAGDIGFTSKARIANISCPFNPPKWVAYSGVL